MAEKFKIEGLKELEKSLLKLGAKPAQSVMGSAARKAMKPVLNDAIQNANEDSGDLRKALAIKVIKGKKSKTFVSANVGTYRKKSTKKQGGKKLAGVNQKAIAQEFGTSKQQAEPFLRPALNSNASRVLSILKPALADGIEKAAKKLAGGTK